MIILDKIARLYTLEGALKKQGRFIKSEDLSPIEDAAIVFDRKIRWFGHRTELPSRFKRVRKKSANGGIVLPGLIDSHTHLVFAGDRSREFEMRLAGKTYQEIANSGGGILNTVSATRKAALSDLKKLSAERLSHFLKQGVTTLEIKTGYGLEFESEKKSLEVIAWLKRDPRCTIKSTFLALHAVPPEFSGRKSEYVKVVLDEWLPKLRTKIDFVDLFLDAGYFDGHDAERLFERARGLGLGCRVHADELELSGGTDVAVKHEVLSADHLLKIGSREIDLLARSDVVATLLPTTAFFLKTDYAPARRLLEAGARVALASDFNPGTSPTQDMSLVGLLAALHMEMRIDEVLTAFTVNAAASLGLANRKGAIQLGFDADLIVIEDESPATLFYSFGRPMPKLKVCAQGKFIN